MNIDPEIRQALSSKVTAKPLIDAFVNHAIEDEKKEAGHSSWITYFSTSLRGFSKTALDIIYKYSESEIEKVFLGTLLLSYLRSNPLGIIFKAPFSNATLQMKEYKETIDNAISWWGMFNREEGTGKTYDEFSLWLIKKEKQAGRLMDFKDMLIEYVSLYEMKIFQTYHLAVQATFPDIKVEGKHIRADILIWIPEIDNFKIIVECDGFQFHGEKAKFISDRKRDRLLQAHGFEVLRYSGSEIHNDPIKTSYDLFEFLEKKKEQLRC